VEEDIEHKTDGDDHTFEREGRGEGGVHAYRAREIHVQDAQITSAQITSC
jgi:hypothetical protein